MKRMGVVLDLFFFVHIDVDSRKWGIPLTQSSAVVTKLKEQYWEAQQEYWKMLQIRRLSAMAFQAGLVLQCMGINYPDSISSP